MIVVLAHYKKWKVWARMSLSVILLPLAIFGGSIAAIERIRDPSKPHYYAITMLPILWFYGLWALKDFVSTFKQVVFHERRLIWLENGQLIWRDGNFFSAPSSDIQKVTSGMAGLFGQFDTIALQMHGGPEKVIKTDAMEENCDDVVHQLQDILGLKEGLKIEASATGT